MNRDTLKHTFFIILFLSGLVLSGLYIFISHPPKDSGVLVDSKLVVDTADMKGFIKHFAIENKQDSTVYARALTILERASNSDISIGYVKDVSNFAYRLLGLNRYWCKVKIGKGYEIDMLLVKNDVNNFSIQSFSLTTH